MTPSYTWSRHPELVSGPISPHAPPSPEALWVLKQVQHDGGGTDFVQAKPLLFRGGVGVGSILLAPRLGRSPTPSPSPEEEGGEAA